jgi:hypothetical protein
LIEKAQDFTQKKLTHKPFLKRFDRKSSGFYSKKADSQTFFKKV